MISESNVISAFFLFDFNLFVLNARLPSDRGNATFFRSLFFCCTVDSYSPGMSAIGCETDGGVELPILCSFFSVKVVFFIGKKDFVCLFASQHYQVLALFLFCFVFALA